MLALFGLADLATVATGLECMLMWRIIPNLLRDVLSKAQQPKVETSMGSMLAYKPLDQHAITVA